MNHRPFTHNPVTIPRDRTVAIRKDGKWTCPKHPDELLAALPFAENRHYTCPEGRHPVTCPKV